MALTYADSAALMTDMTFVSRIKIGCLKYADYIFGEDSTTAAHSSRMKWAQNVVLGPDVAASQITPTVVMDPAVQAAGSAIDDPGLQSAVENAVNRIL